MYWTNISFCILNTSHNVFSKSSELQGKFELGYCKKSFNFTLHIRTYIHIHTHTHTCIHMYIYTRTHTHTHIYAYSLCVACPTFDVMCIRTGECRVLWCLKLVPLRCLKREKKIRDVSELLKGRQDSSKRRRKKCSSGCELTRYFSQWILQAVIKSQKVSVVLYIRTYLERTSCSTCEKAQIACYWVVDSCSLLPYQWNNFRIHQRLVFDNCLYVGERVHISTDTNCYTVRCKQKNSEPRISVDCVSTFWNQIQTVTILNFVSKLIETQS
jgi:hypothetical protein